MTSGRRSLASSLAGALLAGPVRALLCSVRLASAALPVVVAPGARGGPGLAYPPVPPCLAAPPPCPGCAVARGGVLLPAALFPRCAPALRRGCVLAPVFIFKLSRAFFNPSPYPLPRSGRGKKLSRVKLDKTHCSMIPWSHIGR